MLVKTFGACVQGINAIPITIEVHISKGEDMTLVGLPDNAVKESQERIRTALTVNGYHFPNQQVVINMAPADIKKEGAAYDLPLAIGLMAASEQVNSMRLADFMIMGELSLDGTLNPIRGALPMAILAREMGLQGFIVPVANAPEAAVVEGLQVYGMDNIRDVVRFLNGEQMVEPYQVDIQSLFLDNQVITDADFANVCGQQNVKRALEVAAAGGHNIIMVGPPGSGKSMMAKCLPGILPPLSLNEALETTKIHSVAGVKEPNQSLITTRPFRSPHHTMSEIALVGGGLNPMPGEISLAHNGVLFLDELPEFKRSTLEVMRQPLEDRKITIARVKMTVEYPSNFMLVAAMNPCPCGHYNNPQHPCTCTPSMVHKYLSRISGPLLDRIDIQVEITPVPTTELQKRELAEPSSEIRKRVLSARRRQLERFSDYPEVFCNAQMTPKMMRLFCQLDSTGSDLLRLATERLGLSARAYDRILKVSRTIADIAGSDNILPQHLAEAIGYRNLDRETWGG